MKSISAATIATPTSQTIQGATDFAAGDFATSTIRAANTANIATTDQISHLLPELTSASRMSLILNLNEFTDSTSALVGLLLKSDGGSAFGGSGGDMSEGAAGGTKAGEKTGAHT
jgi:hypothetical protein